ERLPSDDARMVLFLPGLNERVGPEQTRMLHEWAFLAAHEVAARFTKEGGIFVTVQDTGGRFGFGGGAFEPNRAWMGGLPGLVKTAALEWPKAQLKSIDMESGARPLRILAEAIFDELQLGGPALEVGLSANGQRTTPAMRAVSQPEPGALPIEAGDVIVVSGGARGVTAATLIPLAQAARCRFVLLGRTPLVEEPAGFAEANDDASLKSLLLKTMKAQGVQVTPKELNAKAAAILAGREVRGTLKNLEEAGSEAVYRAVDVRDSESLNAMLEPIRREWGPVCGVIHGAGVLADKAIADKTLEQFQRVFETKVTGLKGLMDATRGDPLKLLVMFSSIAARQGNSGQCDYAMANELLNKVAQAEARTRGPECRVLSLGWGPWEGGMVTPALKAHFEKAGIPLIPLAAGGEFMTREIAGTSRAVELVVSGPSRDGRLPHIKEPAPESWSEIRVSEHTHDYLVDHTVRGSIVLPAVMAMEWMLRAARASEPNHTVVGMEEFQVVKGVHLDDFATSPVLLKIRGENRTGDGEEPLLRCNSALLSSDGKVHFKGDILFAKDFTAMPNALPVPAKSSGNWPWDLSRACRDILFHGPRFQAIEQLEGCDDEGGEGVLVTLSERDWGEGGAWVIDPLVLDGALQLLLLWGHRQRKRVSLISGIGRFIFASYQSRWPGRIRCRFRCTKSNQYQAYYDVTLLDNQDAVLAQMEQVEITFLPDDKY
ncbi:MAG: SDR family oxidoreductase, partial [Gammaproteobacteria bacterium]|nr:SDR family oxidoreductase [Gammaproteobacteria bacterium]